MLDLWLFIPEQIKDGPPSVAHYCRGIGELKMLLMALKYSRSPEILSVLPRIIRISEKDQKVQSWEYDYLKLVLLYLMSVINEGLIDRFKEIVTEEHRGGEAYMKTIADVFREEERLKREKIERELLKKIELKDSVIKRNAYSYLCDR